eukprot:6026930-Prymnesium_polylepis.1
MTVYLIDSGVGGQKQLRAIVMIFDAGEDKRGVAVAVDLIDSGVRSEQQTHAYAVAFVARGGQRCFAVAFNAGGSQRRVAVAARLDHGIRGEQELHALTLSWSPSAAASSSAVTISRVCRRYC